MEAINTNNAVGSEDIIKAIGAMNAEFSITFVALWAATTSTKEKVKLLSSKLVDLESPLGDRT